MTQMFSDCSNCYKFCLILNICSHMLNMRYDLHQKGPISDIKSDDKTWWVMHVRHELLKTLFSQPVFCDFLHEITKIQKQEKKFWNRRKKSILTSFWVLQAPTSWSKCTTNSGLTKECSPKRSNRSEKNNERYFIQISSVKLFQV